MLSRELQAGWGKGMAISKSHGKEKGEPTYCRLCSRMFSYFKNPAEVPEAGATTTAHSARHHASLTFPHSRENKTLSRRRDHPPRQRLIMAITRLAGL